MCVSVCVCVRERERERENKKVEKTYSKEDLLVCIFLDMIGTLVSPSPHTKKDTSL